MEKKMIRREDTKGEGKIEKGEGGDS
jgi:hypothetical protein